eukprot:scaffold69074_cov60-Phaeocystis_antarctica.AAC.1
MHHLQLDEAPAEAVHGTHREVVARQADERDERHLHAQVVREPPGEGRLRYGARVGLGHEEHLPRIRRGRAVRGAVAALLLSLSLPTEQQGAAASG